MNDPEKVKIHITIAGERIPLTVDAPKQGAVRRTERHVAELFDTWHKRFPAKSDMEILAMVAYQFASYYDDLRDRYEAARDAATQIDDRLQAMEQNDNFPGLDDDVPS
ncbi:MAG: cell division protein ZapA [Muribaculaceae bacterium]|nr:cell division protein ZapA [Muribaculaceae bacterium]